MKARQLINRDPALAAIMGVIATSDFGSDYGADFGDDDDDDDDWGAEFGDDDDDDDDYGDDYGAAAVMSAVKKAKKQMLRKPNPKGMAMLARMAKSKMTTAKRRRSLEPNKGSTLKVERYVFTLSQSLVIGTGSAINLTDQPDTTIRPQRVTMNAPVPMFAFIDEIKVSNVSVTVGGGTEDAFNYSATGVGQSLDLPTINPANRARVTGTYSGLVPSYMSDGDPTFFMASFRGPATIVAGD